MNSRRILILAAHPDDEVVGCAAAIGRAQEQGAEVSALFLTHGCIARETLWPWHRNRYDANVHRRKTEAEAAAQFLGINIIGFASRPARSLWLNLREVRREVEQAIVSHAIDQLWVPAYEGGNADHDGLNGVGWSFRNKVSVLEYAEYNFCGGKAQSQTFPHPNETEDTLKLTSAERARKRAALDVYRSERGNLDYVDIQREVFRPIAAVDYKEPPHEGTLWYARFQWVPFRHPRVDFTTSVEVSAAISAFLQSLDG